MRRGRLLPVAVAAAALISGWLPSIAVAGAGAAEVVVEIRDNKFIPAEVTIKIGTTVRWVNEERRTSHSVLFLGAGGFESERMFPGESWQRRFDTPGVHAYTCGPHPEMKGRVEVTP